MSLIPLSCKNVAQSYRQPSHDSSINLENTRLTHLIGYRAANPDTKGVLFAEELAGEYAPHQQHQKRWLCHVSISETPSSFPGEAGGLDPTTGTTPSFARKKDAKRYAARCAISWLRAQGRMPAEGEEVRFSRARPIQSQQVKLKSKDSSSSSSTPGSDKSITTTAAPPTKKQKISSPSPPPAASPSPFDKTSPSSASQVAQLCSRLGIPPPAYRLEPDESGSEFWGGHAEFAGPDAYLFADVGRVSGVFGGARFAKERVAEGVLEVLGRIMGERVRNRDAVLGGAVVEERDEEGESKG